MEHRVLPVASDRASVRTFIAEQIGDLKGVNDPVDRPYVVPNRAERRRSARRRP